MGTLVLTGESPSHVYVKPVQTSAARRAGDRPQFNASVLDLKALDQFGALRGQPLLKIDGSEWRRELTQIGGRRANHRCELTEAPVGWHERSLLARQ
jgi:hypothetical protein